MLPSELERELCSLNETSCFRFSTTASRDKRFSWKSSIEVASYFKKLLAFSGRVHGIRAGVSGGQYRLIGSQSNGKDVGIEVGKMFLKLLDCSTKCL